MLFLNKSVVDAFVADIVSIIIFFTMLFFSFYASAGSNYCSSGTGIMLIGSREGPAADVAKVLQVCKPGDTIGIPGNTTDAIAILCDFKQSIIQQPSGLILCVINNPPRGQ